MNVSRGSLAIVVHPKANGWLVNVLDAAPIGRYRLPDGHMAETNRPGLWIVESLQQPFDAPLKSGGYRTCQFGCIDDAWLRPLRGGTRETAQQIIEGLTV